MDRKTSPPRGPQLALAGDLSVALINTAGARPDNRQQGIETYADFVTWSQAVGTVSATGAERLLRQAAERPRLAAAASGGTFHLLDLAAEPYPSGNPRGGDAAIGLSRRQPPSIC